MYLENINDISDIKKIKKEELPQLAKEVREALIFKLSNTGGHVGSNLGVVELSVALHYVFESPKDKIVWDVSHQCYPHKILTGRKDAYTNPDKFKNVTGFTNPKESEHDLFTIGHSSTSISLALGLAKGRDVFGGKENIIAIIGDGAMSGGEAYEGLNYAGEYGKNLIIILNDNEQSVAENHGGLYKKLAALRQTNGLCEDNLFKGLNLDYIYYEHGNDVIGLVDVLEKAKDIDHPLVIHIHTVKGKGLKYAEEDREEWHSGAPFNIEDGVPKNGYPKYDTTVYDSLINLLETDDKSIVLTAGTPRALGFVGQVRDEWEKIGRFIDVGIAEENAMAISSGIARYGGNAVFGAYAPFLQRTYDQLSHDLCLNNNPATILVLMPGAYGMKSNTHLGLCDIQMFSHVPNLIYLSPAYREEYIRMFDYAVKQKEHPIAIRVPNRFINSGMEDVTDYSILNKSKVVKEGKDVAIIAVGTLIPKALEIIAEVEKELNIAITLINPIYLTGVDEDLLNKTGENHSLVVTLEDGELDGGYGQRVASFYGPSEVRVINYGISKHFHSDFNADELLAENGISADNIIDVIRNTFLID